MYASIRRYQIEPSAAGEVSKSVQDQFVSIISGVPGFQAYYLIDGGNGELVTVSIFQDQSGAEESTRRASSWVQQNLAQYIQGSPQVTSGRVAVEKTS